MLDVLPDDVLQHMFQHLSLTDLLQICCVNVSLRDTVKPIVHEKINTITLQESLKQLQKLVLFNTDYDAVLEHCKKECYWKKQQLLQNYNGQTSFYSRETGVESLEAYQPCVLLTVPTIQFIRMHIENSIVCNLAVSRLCRGVRFVVDNVVLFHYTTDILELYPSDPSDGFVSLGSVFQFFPIKASAIYALFEFPTTLDFESCMQHIRFDLLHPPFPFIHQYHLIDVPLEIIRPAYMRQPNIFDTDFTHFKGIIFRDTSPSFSSVLYLVDGVEVDPAKLPQYHQNDPKTRVLMFEETRALPIQINVLPACAKTRISFITTNIFSLMMFWRLQCS